MTDRLTDGHFHDGGLHYGWKEHAGHPQVHRHAASGRTQAWSEPAVYVVFTEAHNSEPDIEIWLSEIAAVGHARTLAAEQAEHYGHTPQDHARECELTDEMLASGWIWRCDYGVEADRVTVMRKELKGEAA